MKVKIQDRIYDSAKEPLMLVWETQEELDKFVQTLQQMEPKDGVRKFVEFPDTLDIERVKEFMKI